MATVPSMGRQQLHAADGDDRGKKRRDGSRSGTSCAHPRFARFPPGFGGCMLAGTSASSSSWSRQR